MIIEMDNKKLKIDKNLLAFDEMNEIIEIIKNWEEIRKKLDQLDTFTLCEYKSDQLWVNVWAKINNGCLVISGQDLGSETTKFWGRGEYEYWYLFDKTSTGRLMALLVGEDYDIKNLLYEHFSGLEGCKKLREFCDANGIKYKFDSWHSD
ncbi:hypothetical protein FACS1894137_17640 [Spirochaetia bacterium]|nr:hypothetical protein FACS1894137_17640 [Spirochaetia bacterium]